AGEIEDPALVDDLSMANGHVVRVRHRERPGVVRLPRGRAPGEVCKDLVAVHNRRSDATRVPVPAQMRPIAADALSADRQTRDWLQRRPSKRVNSYRFRLYTAARALDGPPVSAILVQSRSFAVRRL